LNFQDKYLLSLLDIIHKSVYLKLSEEAKRIISAGSIKIRVRRSGMLQQLTFSVKHSTLGNINYVHLYTDRIVDTSELLRIANEIGLPVQAPNASAFPKGTSAGDFADLNI
jgi:outer membrane receptor for monomeric catechols